MTTPITPRDRAKAERADALLAAAGALFAERGFSGVSLEDIGAAAGVSGPAVYRHFAGKQALLGALLITVSRDLMSGGAGVAEQTTQPEERMRELIRFHVGFAVLNSDVIRVHDRDLAHLTDDDRAEVRRYQRAYIDLWISALAELSPQPDDQLRLRVQAVFGLINSTPHSTRSAVRRQGATAELLAQMAYAALLA